MKLKGKLNSFRIEHGICKRNFCSNEENQKYKKILAEGGTLPENVFNYTDDWTRDGEEFYTIQKSDLSEEEIKELLMYKQLSMVKTIKNCVVFFTVLTVIGLIAYLLLLLIAIH